MSESSTPPLCILCGGQPETLLRCADFLTQGGTYTITRCTRCGFLWTIDAPDTEALTQFYGSSYEQSIHPPLAVSWLRHLRLTLQSRSRAHRVIRTSSVSRGNILDIGCGDGDFLCAMKRRGWHAEGVELSTEKRQKLTARGLLIHAPDTLQQLPDASFDVITLWHVLEHLPDPMESLQHIRRLLKPGGICVIAVPNAGSKQARRDASLWFGYDLPRHLWHFTPTSLTSLLATNGFAPTQIQPMFLDALVLHVFITLIQRRKDRLSAIAASIWHDFLWAQTLEDSPCMLCITRCSVPEMTMQSSAPMQKKDADAFLQQLEDQLLQLPEKGGWIAMMKNRVWTHHFPLRFLPRVLRSYTTNRLQTIPADRHSARALYEEGRAWPLHGLTMIGQKRLRNIRTCIEDIVARNIPGDVLEAGVWRGGATIYMRAVLKTLNISDRTVWVADSFDGLPPPDAVRYPADAGDILHAFPYLAISEQEVRANFADKGLLDTQVRFLPGFFSESLEKAPIGTLALIRLDCDMYGSTMEALTALYPKLSPGGYIIVDDYGDLLSCKKAVDDFRRQHAIQTPLEWIDHTGIYWRKEAETLHSS